MADFGFVGPSYEAPSIYQDAQECINFYGEIDPTKQQGARGYTALYPTPGLTKILELDGGEVRGMRTLSGGQWLLAVVGKNVYSITYTTNAVTNGYFSTKVGELTTVSGPVSISDNVTTANGLTAYIVDGTNRYVWIAGSSSTVKLNFQISGNEMYVPSTPCGFLTIGTTIGSYGKIQSFISGLGGIGTYEMDTTSAAGTVTSLNIVNPGYGFTSIPTFTIDLPSASYGTGAQATCNDLQASIAVVAAAGTGYSINDEITIVGGTFTTAAVLKVTAIDGSGGITDIVFVNTGSYTVIPTNPVTVTGGGGSSAQFTMSYGVGKSYTITKGGNFYSSAPAVTVNGGTGAVVTAVAPSFITDAQLMPAFEKLPDTDGPWIGASVCDVMDNYNIYNQVGTQNWAVTDLGSSSSTYAYYGTKDGAPDPIVSLIADHRQVYLLGQQTTEVWVDVGNVISGIVSFPFQRVTGTMMQHGCAAPFSVARFSEQFMYVSKDNRGQAIIGGIQGYQFVRLSTHAVEQSLLNQEVSDAIAYTYQLEGHEFYVVTFPTVDITWVYDLSTQVWHKWLSFDPITGYHRHRSNCGAFFHNQYIVGDYENGKLYTVDNNNYTEDGNTIRRLRRAPHLVTDLQRQYFAEMQIQFQPGVGIQTGQGNDPQAMLRWSNDGGSTWSNEHWVTIGKVGRYKNRAIWRRLGWSRDRIFEVSVSDPVKTVIVSANLKAEQGDN